MSEFRSAFANNLRIKLGGQEASADLVEEIKLSIFSDIN